MYHVQTTIGSTNNNDNNDYVVNKICTLSQYTDKYGSVKSRNHTDTILFIYLSVCSSLSTYSKYKTEKFFFRNCTQILFFSFSKGYNGLDGTKLS